MQVNREHIGIFGKMNSGKSTLMNLLTQQETSITDSTPGTTADTKISFIELHGLGPVKLFDTAGLDEKSDLGEKKKGKVLNVLKECDLVIVVINPAISDFDTEAFLIEKAREIDKQLVVVFNYFGGVNVSALNVYNKVPLLKFYPSISLEVINVEERDRFIKFLLSNFDASNNHSELLPFIEPNEFYVLNIPMDEETPGGRFLRPQSMAVETITRKWAYPVSYRMDLKKARGKEEQEEHYRFDSFLNSLSKKPKVIITDSQAMDIMATWTPADINLTTFSIMMINYGSNGRIQEFYEGAKALDGLQKGDRVLIAEACNHSRIQEDIGTVQIPNILKEINPDVAVEFNFGREFQDNKQLSAYKLIIHCGGCMISNQKLQARLRDLRSVAVPVTNYGVFLSWVQGHRALERVMEPWVNE